MLDARGNWTERARELDALPLSSYLDSLRPTSERWVIDLIALAWQAEFGVPVDILPDDRFIASIPEFLDWAEGRKQLRMEYFYREMRKQTGYLMQQQQPLGKQWNYDSANRKTWSGQPCLLRYDLSLIRLIWM